MRARTRRAPPLSCFSAMDKIRARAARPLLASADSALAIGGAGHSCRAGEKMGGKLQAFRVGFSAGRKANEMRLAFFSANQAPRPLASPKQRRKQFGPQNTRNNAEQGGRTQREGNSPRRKEGAEKKDTTEGRYVGRGSAAAKRSIHTRNRVFPLMRLSAEVSVFGLRISSFPTVSTLLLATVQNCPNVSCPMQNAHDFHRTFLASVDDQVSSHPPKAQRLLG